MLKKRKLIIILALLLIVAVLAVALTGCDATIKEGIVLTHGEQREVRTIQNEDGTFSMMPFFIGFYVEVAETDSNGEIVLKDNQEPNVCWFRTVNPEAYKTVVASMHFVKTSDWSVYRLT